MSPRPMTSVVAMVDTATFQGVNHFRRQALVEVEPPMCLVVAAAFRDTPGLTAWEEPWGRGRTKRTVSIGVPGCAPMITRQWTEHRQQSYLCLESKLAHGYEEPTEQESSRRPMPKSIEEETKVTSKCG